MFFLSLSHSLTLSLSLSHLYLSLYFSISADGLMIQACITGNFEAAVEMCLSEGKMAEAILLAIAGGPELLIRTQKKYFMKNKSTLGRVSVLLIYIIYVFILFFIFL